MTRTNTTTMSRVFHTILAGFFLGAVVFGVWAFVSEPGVGAIAFLPALMQGAILGVVYAVDNGYFNREITPRRQY